MFIYKITNIINKKIYIEQTTRCVKERFYNHCRTMNTSSVISKAIKKYGPRSKGSGDNISEGLGSKPFEVCTKEGEYIGKWINKSQCARDLNLRIEKISACCLGKRKSHKDYIFNYTQEQN